MNVQPLLVLMLPLEEFLRLQMVCGAKSKKMLKNRLHEEMDAAVLDEDGQIIAQLIIRDEASFTIEKPLTHANNR